ncbi:cytochrome P460 family protein [Acidiphilium multivorum]|jgi:hypothetical protein|uniref:cytochrome P460 family protein n=1 Tax=Acidiphilium multivorum TaxID=62140 RepID=UPI0039C97CAE
MNGKAFTAISLGGVFAVGLVCTARATPVVAPSPAKLWMEIQHLEKTRAVMPGSHPFQPGSRNVDVFTTDLSNAAARRAISGAGSILAVTRYPAGSLLIKNNYDAHRKLGGITAMLKLPGYDQANRNWVMAQYAPTGKVVAYGRVNSCDACHAMATKFDFVFAPPPQQLLPVAVWKAFFPKQVMNPAYIALLSKHPEAVVK